MKLTEQLNLFVEPKPFKKNGKDHVFYKITTSIATKQEDDTYLRIPVDVILNPKKFPEEKLAKLDPSFMWIVNVLNGWLMVTDYINKDGEQVKKLAIYIEDMKLTNKTPIDQEKRNKALESRKGSKGGEIPDLPF